MTTQIPYTDAQTNLDRLCDRVVETGEALVITRPGGKNVVLVSEVELSSLLETLYLLQSQTNASRLNAALERSLTGTIQSQTIDDLYRRFGFAADDADNGLKSVI